VEGATYNQEGKITITFSKFGVKPLKSPLTPSCLIVRRRTSRKPSYSYGSSAVPWVCSRVRWIISNDNTKHTSRLIGKTIEAPILPLIAPMHKTAMFPTFNQEKLRKYQAQLPHTSSLDASFSPFCTPFSYLRNIQDRWRNTVQFLIILASSHDSTLVFRHATTFSSQFRIGVHFHAVQSP
jgi:hypothetical protein